MTSKQTIKRRLDELDSEHEFPDATLAHILGCAMEPVDRDRNLYRFDGEVLHLPPDLVSTVVQGGDT